MLIGCRDRQLVTARGRQRTDSTHILAAVRALNRIEVVGDLAESRNRGLGGEESFVSAEATVAARLERARKT